MDGIMNYMLALMLALFVQNSFAKSISIMTYNAENLYDTKHDEGKSDWKWLSSEFKKTNPEARAYCESQGSGQNFCFNYNWDQAAVDGKIKNLSRGIRAYHGNKGPDIVVMEEVENILILQELVDKGLAGEGYNYVALIEGPDSRGIDIGIISRYPIIFQKLHPVDLAGTTGAHRTTRGIFEVEIQVDNKVITVFGNHWPSQANEDDTRVRASEVLQNLIYKVETDLVIATGDFNTHPNDNPHAINLNVLPYFYDSEEILRRQVDYLNDGTHWYKGHWTSLDKIFFLKRSVDQKNIQVIWESYSIVNPSFLLKSYHEWVDEHGVRRVARNIPKRFDLETMQGASDHLPVAIKLEL